MSHTPKAVLSALEITHSYGSQPVLNDISLTVHEGDRIGLIGRNGCGKSTLLQIMAGLISPDGGKVALRQGVSVALLQQRCPLPDTWTVNESLVHALEDRQAQVDAYHDKLIALGNHPEGDPEHDELSQAVHDLQHVIDLTDGWNLDQELKRIRIALGLVEEDRPLNSLSGGELRRGDFSWIES